MAERMTTRSLPGDTVSTRAKLALGVLLLLLLVAPMAGSPVSMPSSTRGTVSVPVELIS